MPKNEPPILTADKLKAMVDFFNKLDKPAMPGQLLGLPVVVDDSIAWPDISELKVGPPLISEEEWEEPL